MRPVCLSTFHTTSRWYSGSRSMELSIIWSYSDFAVYWVVRGGRNTFVTVYCLGSFFDFLDLVAG